MDRKWNWESGDFLRLFQEKLSTKKANGNFYGNFSWRVFSGQFIERNP